MTFYPCREMGTLKHLLAFSSIVNIYEYHKNSRGKILAIVAFSSKFTHLPKFNNYRNLLSLLLIICTGTRLRICLYKFLATIFQWIYFLKEVTAGDWHKTPERTWETGSDYAGLAEILSPGI